MKALYWLVFIVLPCLFLFTVVLPAKNKGDECGMAMVREAELSGPHPDLASRQEEMAAERDTKEVCEDATKRAKGLEILTKAVLPN